MFLSAALGLQSLPPAVADDFAIDGPLQPFLGKPRFEAETLFEGQRFPNVVVAKDGTVVATWGSHNLSVRRSTDAGESWGPEIPVVEGIHGGGALVNEENGDIFLFVHPEHPPRDGSTAPRIVYRSADSGQTWNGIDAKFESDVNGYVPSLHMSEHGFTLTRGPNAGRLIRPARVYRRSPERYATTISSDDGGKTWKPGAPLSQKGTGEGALVELSDGSLLYSPRWSFFEDKPFHHAHLFLKSNDAGATWNEPFSSYVLPDGPRYRGPERRGGNYNGHFGMMAGFTRLPVRDRDILIYSNADNDGHKRIRLTVWASFDGGKTWPIKRLVNAGPSAYSSLVAGRPGTPSEGWIYLQYEHGEGNAQYAGSQIARFNLAWLLEGDLTGDGSLPKKFDRPDQPSFLNAPRVIVNPGPESSGANRAFQGIPSIARSPGGRLWATWYGGKTPGEDHNNYVILATSGDDGSTWTEEKIVLDPDGAGPVRAFDPQVWLSPDGRLWAFWAQSIDNRGTRFGVWTIISDNPDDEDALWTPPRRLTDGVMMGKPTVLSTGEWCLPASTWRRTDHSAKIVVSTDRGTHWDVRGGCHVPKEDRSFDEHMIIEREDGSLWMLARTRYGIGESVSKDQGRTWTALQPSGIAHPSARFFLRKLDSGNVLLVKHGPLDKQTGRSHLTAYLSKDDGATWSGGLLLDKRQGVSYPDGVQADDGSIRLIYDYSRRDAREILMARFTEQDVLEGALDSDGSELRLRVHKATGDADE